MIWSVDYDGLIRVMEIWYFTVYQIFHYPSFSKLIDLIR